MDKLTTWDLSALDIILQRELDSQRTKLHRESLRFLAIKIGRSTGGSLKARPSPRTPPKKTRPFGDDPLGIEEALRNS